MKPILISLILSGLFTVHAVSQTTTNDSSMLERVNQRNINTNNNLLKDNQQRRLEFEVSTTTLPLKLRFGNKTDAATAKRYFHFSQDFSLGLSAGVLLKYDRNGTDPVGAHFHIGLSVTTINVDSATTLGEQRSSTTVGALTPSVLVGFDIPKTAFQFGVAMGWDIMPGKTGVMWVYRKSPFMGLGLSYAFMQKATISKAQNLKRRNR